MDLKVVDKLFKIKLGPKMKNIFIFLIICVLTLNYGISKPNDKTDLTIENLNQYSSEIKSQLKDSINSIDKRLIRIETKQEDYYSNLNFYSILIAVIMAASIALSAFFVNFNNKNMHQQYVKKQNELDSNIKELQKNQEKFEEFVVHSKWEIEKIVGEQEYFHFEIFDTLSRVKYNEYFDYKQNNEITYSLIALTNALTYHNIETKHAPIERKSIYKSSEILDEILIPLENLINQQTQIENDSKFTQENKQIIIFNLIDSLKFTENNSIKHRIQKIIDKFETYKTTDETHDDE